MDVPTIAVSFIAAFWLLLLVVTLTLVLSIVYRRLLHPLKAFPGPLLNSVSDIPGALGLIQGRQHTYYHKLHKKYGPVVRTSPNELVFSCAQAWEDIYGLRKGHVMEKSPIFIGVVSPMDGYAGVGLARGKEHTRQKRALAPGLSRNALYGQQEIIQRHISSLVTALRKLAAHDKAANMADWYSFITFDAIGDLSFSEPFGCLEQGSATEWAKSIVNVTKFATWDQAIRRVAGVDTWLRSLLIKAFMPAEMMHWRLTHLQKSKEKTLKRLANKDLQNQDVIYHLLRNEDSKKALSPTEIILNMVLFVSAGSETTSITLTAWNYLICTHQQAYKSLADEIRSNFHSDSEITVDAVMGLPYLAATINEALRLFPPGAVAMQRVVPAGGATIDGHYVPAGTTVSVAPWAASRSPANFHDPEGFRPERWLPGDHPNWDAHFSSDSPHASRPFGYGPKRCIGEDLSYLEARLILAHLMFNFDLELDMKGQHGEENKLWGLSSEETPIQLYQVLMKPSLWVKLTERK